MPAESIPTLGAVEFGMPLKKPELASFASFLLRLAC